MMKINWLEFLLLVSSILALISKTFGTAAFELQLQYFDNSKGLNKDGDCCNGIRTGGKCQSKCRTFFSVCLTHFQTKIRDNPECTFGRQETPALGENSIDFDSVDPLDFTNPLRFPITVRWPGTFTLIVEAWHDRTQTGPKKGSPRELIMRMALPASVGVQKTFTNDTHTSASGSSSLKIGYRVVCDINYYGEGCSEICRPRDDRFGHYVCLSNGSKECLPGWRGNNCDEAICLPGCDPEKGSCEHPNECKCRPGWEGKLCNQCIPLPGCTHGRCIDKPWTCICYEGWGGLYCNQDLNFCTTNKPCLNGATCTNTGQGSYTCTCAPGYSGRNCEITVGRCNDKNPKCQNGGNCVQKGLDHMCECPEGFGGSFCEIEDPCKSNPCRNGGTCNQQPHGYTCSCPVGFAGSDCEEIFSACKSSPCQNGGTCTDQGDGYRCTCDTGYEGQGCEEDIIDCRPGTCNNGRCEDKRNGYECKCFAGWTGTHCKENVVECDTMPCANGGTCVDAVNDFVCICADGFTGKQCVTKIDKCDSSPCQNGATCVNQVNKFECKCAHGYIGQFCESVNSDMSFSQSTESITSKEPTPDPVQHGGISGPVMSTVSPNTASVTMQQLLLIICLGVGIPILIIIAIIIFLLCTRRRDREPDVLKDNARNEISSMNNKDKTKCIDTNVISAIPPNTNVCLKLTNEQQDSHRVHKSKQHLNSNLDKSLLHKNNTNIKDINTNSITSQKDLDRRKKISNRDKRLEDGSSSLESFADISDISTSIQVVKPINKEPNSKSLLFIEKQQRHPSAHMQEGMLATEV